MTYRLGVDIGGTFTDFALFDEGGGRIAVYKRLTTPADPSVAVVEGTAALLARENVPMAEVDAIAHGTTLVTNSIIERRGATTGMLVTEGFRDLLDMGFEQRYDLFDLRLRWPDPLVPRRRRREVRERIAFDGAVVEPLDLGQVREAVRDLVDSAAIEALAICFLHAYANPAHEEAAGALVRREFPGLHVSRSADVFANMREYERWTTATMNAYTQPMFDRYVERLEHGLAALGFAGRLLLMTSSGASIVPETARRFPVRAPRVRPRGRSPHVRLPRTRPRTPGPPLVRHGRHHGQGRPSSGDSHPLKQYDLEVGRVHEYKRGSGLPAKLPVIDMIEIGSGGGSLARVDERGLIRVGPRSAGADPGPACYGRGGTGATLTDANVVLGYLDPDFFLGGEMRLDAHAARAAIERDVAAPAGLDPIRAAWGVHEIASEDVARAFRIHASERGFDYRNSSMVAFGGSGPGARARHRPQAPDPPRRVSDRGRGHVRPGAAGEPARLRGLAVAAGVRGRPRCRRIRAQPRAPLVEEASGFLHRAGVADPAIVCRLDMRYQGQGYEIEVTVPGGGSGAGRAEAFSRLGELFRAKYAEIFAETFLDEPLEIVSWKVEAAGAEAALGYHGIRGGARGGAKRARRVWFGDAFVECEVLDRYTLEAGAAVEGPAVIEERESTCVLGPGDRAAVDERLNLVAELADGEEE